MSILLLHAGLWSQLILYLRWNKRCVLCLNLLTTILHHHDWLLLLSMHICILQYSFINLLTYSNSAPLICPFNWRGYEKTVSLVAFIYLCYIDCIRIQYRVSRTTMIVWIGVREDVWRCVRVGGITYHGCVAGLVSGGGVSSLPTPPDSPGWII